MPDENQDLSPGDSIRFSGRVITTQACIRIIEAHPEIRKARFEIVTIDGSDILSVMIELAEPPDDRLMTAISDTIYAVLKLRGKVVPRRPGSLPDDGRLIDDRRVLRS